MNYRNGVVGLALFGAAGAQAVIIDDFSQGSYSLMVDATTPVAEAVRNGSTAFLAGGQRDALLQYTGGPQSVDVLVDAGAVQFFNSHSQTSGNLTLQYDGQDGELETDFVQTFGSNLGMNLSAENAFLLNFRFMNGGSLTNVTLTISVTTSTVTVSHSTVVANGLSVLHSVSFANFAGANFSDVRRLDFVLVGPPAADFTLDSISAVPEPATLLALGAGVGLLARRRRRPTR